jgi:hypothetical protein
MTHRFQPNSLAKKCVFLVIWITLFAEAYPLFIGKKELSMGILVQKLEKGAARR